MKLTLTIFILINLISSFCAFAGDIIELKNCLNQGYSNLTNRNSIVAAAIDTESSTSMAFGNSNLDQIFEIGSVTKTFTANLLAQLIETGSINLSDPIPSAYQKQGSTITYQNLTTHTSGIIPGIFSEFNVINPWFPFDGMTIPIFKSLYAKTPLATQPGVEFNYSNIGISLLGLLLAENQHQDFEDLVKNKILKPLEMTDTYFQVPDVAKSRFPTGYLIDADGHRIEIPHWDLYLTAIEPAGGLRSTLSDMIKYAQANLNPEKSKLSASIELTQQKLYNIKNRNVWIGMNWIIQPDIGLIWHNGETYGFNTILAISTKLHQAVVAMTDTTVQTKDENGKIDFDTGLQDVAFKCLK